MLKQKEWKLNIKLFDGEGEGGGTEPTLTPNEPTVIEVPEYINSYVSGIEDVAQKEYLEGLLKDEKGLNTLKNFIKDPKAEWNIDTNNYETIKDEAEQFIQVAKERGWSEEYTTQQLSARVEYLKAQREAMTPELKAADESINNFINTITDVEEKGVYARLAENAAGRKVLLKFMGGSPTPSIGNSGTPGGVAYTKEEFIEEYNRALDSKDENLMKKLKTYANNHSDDFYRDFLS